MNGDLIIVCGVQKAYLSPTGSKYLGEKSETLKVRLNDYLRGIDRSEHYILFVREVHQAADSFYRDHKTYATVGTEDIEIPELFKPYPRLIVNSCRPNAFYKTPLDSELAKMKPRKAIVVGFETHTTVLFTAEELRNRDIEVTVLEALTTAEDDYMHACGINLLSNTLSVDIA